MERSIEVKSSENGQGFLTVFSEDERRIFTKLWEGFSIGGEDF